MTLGALKSREIRRRIVGVAAAAAMSLGLAVGPAGAIELAVSDKPTTGANDHCVVTVVDTKSDGELVTSDPMCFRTFSQSVAFSTGGAVQLPAGTQGTMLNDGGFNTLMGSYTLAMHFDGYYGTGASITIVGGGCGGYWNTSSWWDNRISSTYNVCQKTRHYSNPGLSGSYATLSGGLMTHNLPWYMNNNAESIRYIIA